MTRRPKDIGTAFETLVVNAFHKVGFPKRNVRRLILSGRADQGDVLVEDLGHYYILECKAVQKIDLASFVKQAQVEAENYRKANDLPVGSVTGLAVIKRRNHGVWDSYVVTDLQTFFDVDPS